MLSRYNPIDIEHALRETSPPPPFPRASDRAAWNRIGGGIGSEEAGRIIAQAEADAASTIPVLPATRYLEFARNGQREGYERPAGRRREMLRNLTLAECLEGQGRFLDPILDAAWAICEESSWSWPAHQHELADMERPVIDLGVAMTALDLAEMDSLLGAQLDPALARRIRYEVNRRCFTPYLTRHDHWWLYNSQSRTVNNWTAVCNAGVTGAAIYLEPDLARLAEMIARCARSLDDYLATFDPDGGSSEGPGYWSYGFGYFTMIAFLVEQRTDGRISFLAGDQIRNIAQYPLRTVLSPGLYVNFSDSDRHFSFNTPHLVYLSQRLNLPDLMRLARAYPGQRSELSWSLRRLIRQPSAEPPGRFVPGRHDWFSGMMWMIARADPSDADALVLAAKGGHNGEMHNQNDVGNIIVHVNGESVIADIGRGRYTRAYFGSERYDHFVNSSLGHSVPVVNGHAQLPGQEHGAILLEHRSEEAADLLLIEMKDAYPPEADLASLRRTVALYRSAEGEAASNNGTTRLFHPFVELVDEVRFAARPGTLASVLITLGQVEIGADSALLRGDKGVLQVRFDAEAVTPHLEVVPGVDLAEARQDVRRLVFSLRQPAQAGTIRLRIEPG